MKRMRLLIEIIVVITLIAGAIRAASLAYLQGISDGQNAGYKKGYSDGTTQGYNKGYSDGEVYGYNNGRTQGKDDTYAALIDWMRNSGCAQTSTGYVEIKVWQDYEGKYQQTCIVRLW